MSGATPTTTGAVGAIIALDTRTGVLLRTIPLRESPRALAVDTRAGIVVAATAHGIIALDVRTGALLYTTVTPTLVNPVLAVDEQASRVVVAGSFPDTTPYASQQGMIDVLDTRSGRRLRALTLRGGPASVAVDARTARAFVSVDPFHGNGYVAVLDTASGRLVQTTPVAGTPERIAVDTRTARVFVIVAEGAVSVLDARSGILVGTAPVGETPWALTVNEQIGRVFVVNQARRSTVSKLDAASGRLLGAVAVGENNAVAVATDAATGRVFVVNGGALHTSANINPSASVSELDAVSGRLLRAIPLSTAFFPRSVVVDERAGRAFVVSVPSAGAAGGAVAILDTTR